jgi:hypothetical protein
MKKSVIILSALFLLFLGCGPRDYVYIKNRTNDTIYIKLCEDRELNKELYAKKGLIYDSTSTWLSPKNICFPNWVTQNRNSNSDRSLYYEKSTNCNVFFLLRSEKVLLHTGVHSMLRDGHGWRFNHIEIIYPDKKFAFTGDEIPKLWGIGNRYGGRYTLVLKENELKHTYLCQWISFD